MPLHDDEIAAGIKLADVENGTWINDGGGWRHDFQVGDRVVGDDGKAGVVIAVGYCDGAQYLGVRFDEPIWSDGGREGGCHAETLKHERRKGCNVAVTKPPQPTLCSGTISICLDALSVWPTRHSSGGQKSESTIPPIAAIGMVLISGSLRRGFLRHANELVCRRLLLEKSNQ